MENGRQTERVPAWGRFSVIIRKAALPSGDWNTVTEEFIAQHVYSYSSDELLCLPLPCKQATSFQIRI